jgi:hypothetical protein
LSKDVTTLFRNPTTPATGAATEGVGATVTATDAVTRLPREVFAAAASTVGTTLGSVADAED